MRNLLNPKWILLINTLPVVILFILFFREFEIIQFFLKEENLLCWKVFGICLMIIGLLNLGYAVYLIFKNQSISIYYAVLSLAIHTTFIYLYSVYSDYIIPFSVPRWMVSENIANYVGTFLMPTLAYTVLICVYLSIDKTKENTIWKNFAIAAAVPLAWYIFFQLLLPLNKSLGDGFGQHASIIIIIISTLAFHFFLIRGLYILISKKGDIWKDYQLVWKIPISLILPIIGLLVNADFNDVFGNFNNKWFYIIAVINSLVICLPACGSFIYRFILFFLRAATFSYTFYFFIVFLPFLPLSIFAIIAIGTGFLMLTPLFLFVLQVHLLAKDFNFLQSLYSNIMLWVLACAAFLILPTLLTINYLGDRSTLESTLEYIYSSDYSKEYQLDKESLNHTLNVIKDHKNDFGGGMFGMQQPYLSTYFNWLVLDNLTLSDSKIRIIEKVFFGKSDIKPRLESRINGNVKISGLTSHGTYSHEDGAYRTWVDLELTNGSDLNMQEFVAKIELPDGAWVSDYYLFVDDVKEKGILAEKKAAMWVYSNIRNTNRDPGILYYLTGNQLAFRVFPFNETQVRKTGFEILHKDPFQLTINDHSILLGDSSLSPGFYEDKNISYLSASKKGELKSVVRAPYFHFVVDVTNEDQLEGYVKNIKKLSKLHPELSANAKVSFVNSYVKTVPFDSDWDLSIKEQSFEGGFYLDKAIKTLLFSSYKMHEPRYPLIVVLTDDLDNAILENNFADWQFSFPESDLFYVLDDEAKLEPHSLMSHPFDVTKDTVDFTKINPVLSYKTKDGQIRYLRDNNKPSFILNNEDFTLEDNNIHERSWVSAASIQGKWQAQVLHPETSDSQWLDLVKFSFLSKVMTPVTSYIVVENEAQRLALKRKQEEILNGNKSLDPDEDTPRMSEPELWLLGLLILIIIWFKKRKRVLLN